MDALAGYFKLFSEPTRLAVLNTLRNSPLNVTAVVEATGLSQAFVSKHLKLLTIAAVVRRRFHGLRLGDLDGVDLDLSGCDLTGGCFRDARFGPPDWLGPGWKAAVSSKRCCGGFWLRAASGGRRGSSRPTSAAALTSSPTWVRPLGVAPIRQKPI